MWRGPTWLTVFRDAAMTAVGAFVVIWSTVFGGDTLTVDQYGSLIVRRWGSAS